MAAARTGRRVSCAAPVMARILPPIVALTGAHSPHPQPRRSVTGHCISKRPETRHPRIRRQQSDCIIAYGMRLTFVRFLLSTAGPVWWGLFLAAARRGAAPGSRRGDVVHQFFDRLLPCPRDRSKQGPLHLVVREIRVLMSLHPGEDARGLPARQRMLVGPHLRNDLALVLTGAGRRRHFRRCEHVYG